MEAFSLLKYWKGGANASPSPLPQNDVQTDPDDGPFFDLELALPDDDTNDNQNDEEDDDDNNNNDSDSDSDSDKEFKFTLSPSTSSNERSLSLSPSDDLIFNSEPNSKPPQFTASLLKSATKIRVFMLGLKKPKPNAAAAPNPKHLNLKKPRQKKLFTVKFKVEEVPIVSLFTRDNSSRGKASQNHNTKESESESESSQTQTETDIVSSGSEEKRLMRKYLKMVKPLYVRVSRRYAEKLRFSEQVDVSSPESSKAATPPSTVAEKVPMEGKDSETGNVKVQKQGNVALPAGLRKHLGKGRSAAAAAPQELVSSKRRDDSLLQQQDWIQGAILHCKKSFNASTECETSQLPRSLSDPLRDISPELSEKFKNDS